MGGLLDNPTDQDEPLCALVSSTNWNYDSNDPYYPSSFSVCYWNGVWCDGFVGLTGPVTEIDLNNYGISGSIPTEIGGLSSLTKLILNHNTFYGTIPTEIGDLTNLQELKLQ